MKRIYNYLAVLSLLIIGTATLCSCGVSYLWQSDFSEGNNNVFGIYGTVVDNEDNTITLKKDASGNYSASTYFGQKSKNYDWQQGGMNVELKVYVDTNVLTNGNYFVWSLAINELDGTYLTELPVFFIGTSGGVKFAYSFTGVDADYTTIANLENSATLTSGYYTINYKFKTEENGEIKATVTLVSEGGNEVYNSGENTFTVIDPTIHEGKNYTDTTVVKEDMVKGLRYLWLVRTSVDVKVASVAITK